MRKWNSENDRVVGRHYCARFLWSACIALDTMRCMRTNRQLTAATYCIMSFWNIALADAAYRAVIRRTGDKVGHQTHSSMELNACVIFCSVHSFILWLGMRFSYYSRRIYECNHQMDWTHAWVSSCVRFLFLYPRVVRSRIRIAYYTTSEYERVRWFNAICSCRYRLHHRRWMCCWQV